MGRNWPGTNFKINSKGSKVTLPLSSCLPLQATAGSETPGSEFDCSRQNDGSRGKERRQPTVLDRTMAAEARSRHWGKPAGSGSGRQSAGQRHLQSDSRRGHAGRVQHGRRQGYAPVCHGIPMFWEQKQIHIQMYNGIACWYTGWCKYGPQSSIEQLAVAAHKVIDSRKNHWHLPTLCAPVARIEPSTGSSRRHKLAARQHLSGSLPQPPSPLLALLNCAYPALAAGVEAR